MRCSFQKAAAATSVALELMTGAAAAQEPTCDLRLVGDGYSVCYEPGYAQDAELAREILDLAAQRLRVKYGPPDPFDLDVKLYTAPTGAVQAGRAYFDGRAIHYLPPSAPTPLPSLASTQPCPHLLRHRILP